MTRDMIVWPYLEWGRAVVSVRWRSPSPGRLAPMMCDVWGRAPDVTPGRPPPVAPDHRRPALPRVPGRGPGAPLTPKLVPPPEL